MRSVADDLRQRDPETVLKLSPEERIALALRLGERDLELFYRVQGLWTGRRRSASSSAAARPAAAPPDA
jgi:hypothetical protein